EHMLVGTETKQSSAQQRALRQIKRLSRLTHDQPIRLPTPEVLREITQIHHRQSYCHRICDHLDWSAVDGGERRPQYLMPLHHGIYAVLQSRNGQSALQAKCKRDVVKWVAGFQLVKEPQTLLSERQRQRAIAFGWPDRGRHLGRLLSGRFDVFGETRN